MRDVHISISYIWLWGDEFYPGEDSPGVNAIYVRIFPGKFMPFKFSPDRPLSKRSVMYFDRRPYSSPG